MNKSTAAPSNRKHVTANAYRASDAINAVSRELNKRGYSARKFEATLLPIHQPDAEVAIVCLTTSDGSRIAAKDRRTYMVTFTIIGKREVAR